MPVGIDSLFQPLTIQTTTLTGDRAGPHLLITGGVHGDEFEPMAAIRRLIRLLEPNGLRGRVTLAPVVNESAYRCRHRCGKDGLDLARTCPGKPDGTITECTAHALSRLIQAADFYIDLHSGGTTLSVFPLAGYMLHPDGDILETQRSMAHAFNLPVVWGTTPNLDGRSLSVARDAHIPAVYAEYHGGATCDPAGVEAYVEGCLNIMALLGMLMRERPPSLVRYVVEDARENAGYMQIQNPAPRTGYFDPAVRLGDRVKAGQTLGTVSDIPGEEVVPVYAGHDGLVLVLRTYAYVEAGESLAVLLEADRAHEGVARASAFAFGDSDADAASREGSHTLHAGSGDRS
jgi:predicted deacylase